MNANADDATNPDTDAPAAAVIAEEGAAEPAKPARRKRAAKPAAPAAEGPSSDASAEAVVTDKPVRRRRTTAKASDADSPPSDAPASADPIHARSIEPDDLAPVVDTDEIVDDALGIFGVQIRAESRGLDALMLEDLRHAGVEIREGQRARVREGFWGEYISLWVRRSADAASA